MPIASAATSANGRRANNRRKLISPSGRTRIVRRPTALVGSFDLIFRLDLTLTGIPGNAKRQAVVPGCPRSHFALVLRNRRGRGTMQHIGRSRVSKRAQTALEMHNAVANPNKEIKFIVGTLRRFRSKLGPTVRLLPDFPERVHGPRRGSIPMRQGRL
jgi:hypothetical protein